MHLSRRSNSIQPSATLSISARAKEMKANNIDVVNFGAGEPDFPTPEQVKDAARKAIDENYTG
ncbi:MAG: aspartate aminotransferase, partial [bacterium]